MNGISDRRKLINTLIAGLRYVQINENLDDSEVLLSEAELESLVADLERPSRHLQVTISGGVATGAGSNSVLASLFGLAIVDFDVDGDGGNAIALSTDVEDEPEELCWEYPVCIEPTLLYQVDAMEEVA